MSRRFVFRCLLALLCCASFLAVHAQDATYEVRLALDPDGSGNIITVGADTSVYDELRRIHKATAGGIEQTFTYDRHGNITKIATEGESGGDIAVGAICTTVRLYDRATVRPCDCTAVRLYARAAVDENHGERPTKRPQHARPVPCGARLATHFRHDGNRSLRLRP